MANIGYSYESLWFKYSLYHELYIYSEHQRPEAVLIAETYHINATENKT